MIELEYSGYLSSKMPVLRLEMTKQLEFLMKLKIVDLWLRKN
jgi:hypothetical protein